MNKHKITLKQRENLCLYVKHVAAFQFNQLTI